MKGSWQTNPGTPCPPFLLFVLAALGDLCPVPSQKLMEPSQLPTGSSIGQVTKPRVQKPCRGYLKFVLMEPSLEELMLFYL